MAVIEPGPNKECPEPCGCGLWVCPDCRPAYHKNAAEDADAVMEWLEQPDALDWDHLNRIDVEGWRSTPHR